MGGTLPNDQFHRIIMTETGSGGVGVTNVIFKGVLLAHDGRDASLGVVCIGLNGIFFGDQEDGPVIGNLEGKGESRNPGADHKKINGVHRGFFLIFLGIGVNVIIV